MDSFEVSSDDEVSIASVAGSPEPEDEEPDEIETEALRKRREQHEREKKRRREIRDEKRRALMTPERLERLESHCHDAAQMDVDYAVRRLVPARNLGNGFVRYSVNRARLYDVLAEVFKRRDLRTARTVLNILAMMWLRTTPVDIQMLEHLTLYVWPGPDL